MKQQLTLGIVAHVDSGKTTLSEALLHLSGTQKHLGRVDHGNAFLDTHQLERARGITIFAKQAECHLQGVDIHLLDTPGHVDFSTEMERTLQVLDYAILVISGTDGVQSHTETLWHLLRRYQVPTFLFVNKMDLDGADQKCVLTALQQKLHPNCVDFTVADDAFYEAVAMATDELTEQFLEDGTCTDEAMTHAISQNTLFPCLFGSALKLQGVSDFFNTFIRYTDTKQYPDDFAAKVFKISHDDAGNRLTHLKVTGGSLRVRQLLCDHDKEGNPFEEKITALRVYSGAGFQSPEEVEAGGICAVTGLQSTFVGQGLGAEQSTTPPMLQPVLSYRVCLPEQVSVHTALQQFRLLQQEDPTLQVIWQEAIGQLQLYLMGAIQLEVLQTVVADRFGYQVTFERGGILYKESIKGSVCGAGHFEPLRHYAEVHLLLQPRKAGSGLLVSSDCSTDQLDRQTQNLILSHLKEGVLPGVLGGFPLTDLKVTLIAGRSHNKHTHGGDFRQATLRALRQGLMKAESVLLEPIYRFTLTVPTEAVGRAMTHLQQMGATFSPPDGDEEMATITGTVPVSTALDYSGEVSRYTKGRGRFSVRLNGYHPCHDSDEVLTTRGYDPLADLDFPADSVFCAHGAGFTVPWEQADEMMHVEHGYRKKETMAYDEEPTVKKRHTTTSNLSLEDDKSLRAIFESTYGAIRKPVNTPQLQSRKKELSGKGAVKKSTPAPTGPQYLLVDGYNIIFAWPHLSALAKEDLSAARAKLMDILSNYSGYRRNRLILVFDAYKVKGNRRTVERYHNIDVVYTKEAETADQYIEKVTHEMGKKHRVQVATSDGLQQCIILGHGATRLSAASFLEEVTEAEQEIQKQLQHRL